MEPRIHHFGQIVQSVDRHLERSFWEVRSEIVEDPIQRSRLVLVSYPGDHVSPFVELVEPLGEDSPVWSALERGGGWHHVCYAVGSREEGDRIQREKRLLPVTKWAPAVLFGGREVRFLYTRSRELIEFFADEGRG